MPLVRPHLPLLRGKNGKALINLRKAENDDIEALNVRSIKNSKSRWSAPRSLHLLLPSTEKCAVQLHGIVEIVFGWREQIINFCRQTNRKRHG